MVSYLKLLVAILMVKNVVKNASIAWVLVNSKFRFCSVRGWTLSCYRLFFIFNQGNYQFFSFQFHFHVFSMLKTQLFPFHPNFRNPYFIICSSAMCRLKLESYLQFLRINQFCCFSTTYSYPFLPNLQFLYFEELIIL